MAETIYIITEDGLISNNGFFEFSESGTEEGSTLVYASGNISQTSNINSNTLKLNPILLSSLNINVVHTKISSLEARVEAFSSINNLLTKINLLESDAVASTSATGSARKPFEGVSLSSIQAETNISKILSLSFSIYSRYSSGTATIYKLLQGNSFSYLTGQGIINRIIESKVSIISYPFVRLTLLDNIPQKEGAVYIYSNAANYSALDFTIGDYAYENEKLLVSNVEENEIYCLDESTGFLETFQTISSDFDNFGLKLSLNENKLAVLSGEESNYFIHEYTYDEKLNLFKKSNLMRVPFDAEVLKMETFKQHTIISNIEYDSNKGKIGIIHTSGKVEFFEAKAVGIEFPQTVVLKVVDTEPFVKRATASAQVKPAILETGLRVIVPGFVTNDELIRVNTETGEYVERAAEYDK